MASTSGGGAINATPEYNSISARKARLQSTLEALLNDPVLGDVPKKPTLSDVDTLINLELGSAKRISIRKLDGTSIDVAVMNSATVKDLKLAIKKKVNDMEESRMGHRHISWKHVWANFCLLHHNEKLLNDDSALEDYGIRNNSQSVFYMYEIERLMKMTTSDNSSSLLSQSEQHELINKLGVFKIQGTDRRGLPILRIIGKLFPGKVVGVEAVKKFFEDEIFCALKGRRFSVLYVHSGVDRKENSPGNPALKSMFDAVPAEVVQKVEAVYFLHPSLQCRLYLATFGRLLFSGAASGFYSKMRYVNTLNLLRNSVRWDQLEMPEFVYDYDEEKEEECCPKMDFGLESDHPRLATYRAPSLDWTVSTYSTRSIA
ncbi:hypothetical protein F511_18194 [Dorcoceras hygrometricum]|uniref:Ubiquitin-like domain-containing protein n=1 Tax=Dorcoceras hygrometricum TaxID=472368 RepID=A0A2Z7BM60_9LAMI|nr:hypothetical protein F511_18194 [Dorcoceras hygrometricum]